MATRHATSKIECLEDIYEGTGLTMGFRGEALFAMACVSDSLVVASRTEDDELATKLVFGKDGTPIRNNNNNNNEGELLARKVGTTVAVVKPFSNLPARRADLVRRIKQERTRIFKLVESYGIFNVGVCFRLMDIHDNREDAALATSAASTKLEETASTLLGPAFLKGITSLELSLESFFREKQKQEGANNKNNNNNSIGGDDGNDGICYNWGIRGLISVEPSLAAAAAQQQKPQRRGASSSSRSAAASRARIVQYYSINGRVVEMPKVTAMLKRLWLVFSSSMGSSLKQKKPSAILEFTLPNDAFDINLSPDKKTVLLTHEEDLLGVIEEHVTNMWSDESSNVFVDGSLSQPKQQPKQANQQPPPQQSQQEQQERYKDQYSTRAGVGGSNAPNGGNAFALHEEAALEEEGENKSRGYYENDEDEYHKHKRRFAFVHDISKAKMQHDMAERRASDECSPNYAEEGRQLKQTKLTPIVQTKDPFPIRKATKPSHEEGQPECQPSSSKKEFRKATELSHEEHQTKFQPSPSKKAKLTPKVDDGTETSASPSDSRREEEPKQLQQPSPEDRLSDLDRRKWTEIQSKFSLDNDGDNELSVANPLPRHVSDGGCKNEATAAPENAPVTPEDSTMEVLPSAMVASVFSSRPRLNLKQFAFQSSTHKSSDNDASNRNRRSTKTSMPPPNERPPPPIDSKNDEEKSNGNITRSRKRKEIDENESVPLPVSDLDHRIQNGRISKEIGQVDDNLNADMKDVEAPSDGQPSTQVVWKFFSTTEDICLSARLERLNMRKRKQDIDEIRRSIRSRQNGKSENARRGTSGSQGSPNNEVVKEVAFDDVGDGNEDSGFIRMPKSTFRSGMQVIGQFNLGFILARCSRNHLWILDQHACDEKYKYEQLCKKTVMHEQPLIRPLPLELTPSEEACVLDNMEIFEANGFRFSFDDQAPIRHRLSLTALPHSGAHEGRKAVQFGPSDVSGLCSILTEGSSYDAGSGGTGTDGNGMYGNNAVRRHAGTGASSSDRSDRLLARLPKAIAMFASRACRTSIMIGTALSHKEMNTIVQKLAKVDVPWNCPHGRPTMRHVTNVLPMLLKDERRAAEHIAVPTITVVPVTQKEDQGN